MKSCGTNLLLAYFRDFIFGFLVISQISFKLAATTPIIASLIIYFCSISEMLLLIGLCLEMTADILIPKRRIALFWLIIRWDPPINYSKLSNNFARILSWAKLDTPSSKAAGKGLSHSLGD